MVDSEARPRRAAFWLATGAVAWAAGFTAWVLTASFYEPGGETILEANDEPIVRVALLVPLVTSAFVWLALHVACRDGRRAARTAGLVAASVLVAFALLTGFTIGTFFLPGAIALTVAAAITPTRS
jgi:FtsH-binding integral membrane protein